MNEKKARKILGDWIQGDETLFCLGHYIAWPSPSDDKERIVLDAQFSLDELEAIAWWMRNK